MKKKMIMLKKKNVALKGESFVQEPKNENQKTGNELKNRRAPTLSTPRRLHPSQDT